MLVLLFMYSVCIPLAVFSQKGDAMPDETWALGKLLIRSSQKLDQEIQEWEKMNNTSRRNFAIGILYTHRYILTEKRSNAFDARDYLENAVSGIGRTPLWLAYRGMAASFIAGIRTIFGGGSLDTMEKCFDEIPKEYKGWYVRFLRAVTLAEVLDKLPRLFFYTDLLDKAEQYAKGDIAYVRKLYAEQNTGGISDNRKNGNTMSGYLNESLPDSMRVPEEIILRIEQLPGDFAK